MDIDDLIGGSREAIVVTAAGHGARNVRVFGSVARGEAGPGSDIDFLVEFDEGRGLLDLVGLIDDLRELLGRNVDVAEPDGLHWAIRERVLDEAVPLGAMTESISSTSRSASAGFGRTRGEDVIPF